MPGIQKIISGGQTGIDRMALEVAWELKIPTGGTAAKGFLTETGPDLTLAGYGLTSHEVEGYPARTRKNVIDADGTVLYGDIKSVGSRTTKQYCIQFSKPYIENPTVAELHAFLIDNAINILNVAGNRASKMTINQLEEYKLLFRSAVAYHLQNVAHEHTGKSKRL